MSLASLLALGPGNLSPLGSWSLGPLVSLAPRVSVASLASLDPGGSEALGLLVPGSAGVSGLSGAAGVSSVAVDSGPLVLWGSWCLVPGGVPAGPLSLVSLWASGVSGAPGCLWGPAACRSPPWPTRNPPRCFVGGRVRRCLVRHGLPAPPPGSGSSRLEGLAAHASAGTVPQRSLETMRTQGRTDQNFGLRDESSKQAILDGQQENLIINLNGR